MNKTYFAPKTVVVKLRLQPTLQTGSPASQILDRNATPITDENAIGSRRGSSIWDED